MTSRSLLKRYRVTLVTGFSLLLFSTRAGRAEKCLFDQLETMFLVMSLIFVLPELLDVWASREAFIGYMSKGSGLKGAALGIVFGAFRVAVVLVDKRASSQACLCSLEQGPQ